jgi:hypothetical protein
VSQEERSIFWEVIVSVIIIQKVCMYMSYSKGFQDRAISLYRNVKMHSDEQHAVLTRVAKCSDVDDGIFENVLY